MTLEMKVLSLCEGLKQQQQKNLRMRHLDTGRGQGKDGLFNCFKVKFNLHKHNSKGREKKYYWGDSDF